MESRSAEQDLLAGPGDDERSREAIERHYDPVSTAPCRQDLRQRREMSRAGHRSTSRQAGTSSTRRCRPPGSGPLTAGTTSCHLPDMIEPLQCPACARVRRLVPRRSGGHMNRVFVVCVVLTGFSLTAPAAAHAQTFKVEKFDIKGDGGTDYVAVEPA